MVAQQKGIGVESQEVGITGVVWIAAVAFSLAAWGLIVAVIVLV